MRQKARDSFFIVMKGIVSALLVGFFSVGTALAQQPNPAASVPPVVAGPSAPGVAAPNTQAAATPAAAPPAKDAPAVVNPFLPDSFASKNDVSRQEISDMMKNLETRLHSEINQQNQAQQNVDTKQLNDLLGSLTATDSVDDMIFIGCVNGKAVYRTKDQATVVVSDEVAAKNETPKPYTSLNRCKK